MGLTILALTAASPKISAPKIEIDEEKDEGNRKSLSLNISQINNIKNASIVAGKGTPALCVINDVSNVAGIVS